MSLPTSTHLPDPAPASAVAVRLRWTEKIGYAAGDFASCLYFGIFMSFLSYYYTDVVGISAAAVGTMLFVVRTIDWIADPIMGVIADRTDTQMGSFRPWLVWMIIPYVVIGIVTFTAFDLGPAGTLVYAYVSYTALMLVYTAINIPYSALMGVMTARSEERTVLSSFRFVGAAAGNLVVNGTLLFLVAHLGRGNDRLGFTFAVSVYAVLAAALFLATFFTTRERIKPARGQARSIVADLHGLLRNGPWLVMMAVSLLTIIGAATRGGTVLYYFKYCSGSEHRGALFLTVGNLAYIGAVLLTKNFAQLFGSKKSAFIGLMSASAALNVVFYFIDPANLPLIMAHQIVLTVIGAPLMPLYWSMIADTADFGAWKHGHRSTGLLFSAGIFSQKIGWSIGPAIALWLLGSFGFRANVAQTPETLHGLLLLMSVIPAGISLVAAAAALLYPIDARMEKEMEAAMKAASS